MGWWRDWRKGGRVRVVTSGLDALTHGQGLVPRCRVSALWVELPSAHKRLSIQVFMGKVPVLKIWATGSLTKMYNICEFQGGGDSSHLHLSWELVAELIMKWTQDKWAGQGGGWKETHVHGGLIEMGPKKWPRQATFILFRQRNNAFLEILFLNFFIGV